jgi:hypothetical protein
MELLFEGGPWANQLLDSSVHTAPELVAPDPDRPGIYRRTNQRADSRAVTYEWFPDGSGQSREVLLVEGIVRQEASTQRLAARPPRVGDKTGTRVRLALDVVGAVSALGLAILTLVWRDWIETLFRVNPDAASGTVEWVVVFAFAAVSIGLGLMARHEWRQLKLAT